MGAGRVRRPGAAVRQGEGGGVQADAQHHLQGDLQLYEVFTFGGSVARPDWQLYNEINNLY